jgi:hypothetical protein
VISRFPTNIQPIQLQRLQAGLQLGSGHGQFSRHRDLSPELRAAAWKKLGRFFLKRAVSMEENHQCMAM